MKEEKEMRKYYIQDNDQKKYIKNLQIIEINMDKITKECYFKSEYKYLGMLDLEPRELKELAKGDEVLKSYSKEVEELNEKEEFQSIMTQEEQAAWLMEGFKKDARKEGLAEGLAEVRDKGRAEGKKETLQTVVKNIYDNKVDIDIIVNSTGLSKKEILKIVS